MKRLIFCTAFAAAIAGLAYGDFSNDCWCRVLHPAARTLETTHPTESSRTPCLKSAVSAETQLHVIDILIAFDSSSIAWLTENGKGDALSYAQSCIAKMNNCLENSGLLEDFSFRLAGCVAMSINAAHLAADTMQNSMAVLNNLIDGYGRVVAKGEWKKITDYREEVGADIVSVLIDNGAAGCMGLGYSLDDSYAENLSLIPEFGDWAYHVVSVRAADVGYTQLHEVGHNMGCGHPDASCASELAIDIGPQLFPYSAGYYSWIGERGYYTIMGYNFGGLRPNGTYCAEDRFEALPYFSSPNLSFAGNALGTALNDNVSTLRRVYKYVAQYRTSKISPPPPSKPDDNGLVGEFYPTKALNGAAPYVGAVYDAAKKIKGIVQLKIGEASKTGVSKVSATIIGMDGKKKSAKAVQVPCGESACAPVMNIKDWGNMTLTLGGNGFFGTLEGGYTVATANIGGELAAGAPTFRLQDFDFASPDEGYAILDAISPDKEPIVVKGTKWMLAKSASIKYKKVVEDKKLKLYRYDLFGCGDNIDPNKQNVSGLKLSYSAKTGLFKGSFTVYATNAENVPHGKSPKLKKYKLDVSGFVVDGEGIGNAVFKKTSQSWSVGVR